MGINCRESDGKVIAMDNLRDNKGVTLVEIVVSLAILGIISAAFATLFTNGFRVIFSAGDKTVALYEAQDSVENIIAENHPAGGTSIPPLTMYFNDISGSGLTDHEVAVEGRQVEDINNRLTAFLPDGPVNTGPSIAVTSVSVNPTSITVVQDYTRQINVAVSPSNATNKALTWSSSNETIATVSSTGLVTGVAVGGPVTITVTTEDGSFTATSSVVVISLVTFSSLPLDQYVKIQGNLFQKIGDNRVLRRTNLSGDKWSVARDTAAALHNSFDWSDSSGLLTKEEADSLILETRNNGSDWWTLTQSAANRRWERTASGGENSKNENNSSGVRPALTLQSGLFVVGGSGTAADPYILSD